MATSPVLRCHPNGQCEHLHGIAPALDRPITGRPLPRELLQSHPPARQRGGTNGDIDDARPIGIDNIPARARRLR
ncbi:jg15781 [Pararge aegeria aegeria]|uniref:Jg15781 protein n=1 Tax=Pararge aegeria aegeria TaxID=348720 RepID=A0A8S4RJ43_9NEOP|nr:jg15781 [Pararge aegeria aegeria]